MNELIRLRYWQIGVCDCFFFSSRRRHTRCSRDWSSDVCSSDHLQEFGQAVLAPDGRVDRAKLSAIVFADRSKLDRLNAIVHPRVAEVVFRQFEDWQRGGTRDAAFVEAALLIESGIHKKLDGLLVPWCQPEQQLQRLLARGLSEAEARCRIAAQLPAEEKLLLATEKIDCSGSLEQTRRQVEALAAKLRRGQSPR